ncbi:MAG: AAA family ATPase [Puniceicoccales bacterium]|jgi:ATP-dependent exoDNAse (exonuclease V) alpha subunit|nr:AAA family ATPase [Puniceicoccales bacterium]
MTNNLQLTDEYKAAIELAFAHRNMWIDGHAGCGKSIFSSVFLREMLKNFQISHVYLAPTGIAAVHVRGMSIHSFFGFGVAPLINEELLERRYRNLNPQLKNRIKAVQTIVIDEVSMVRCDLLDAVDAMCRFAAAKDNKQLPFGGKQIILIGDLGQLEPIVADDDIDILKERYGPGDYFFHRSRAFGAGNFEHMSFTHNFRQSDDCEFFEILNAIRAREINAHQLEKLNERFCATRIDRGIFLVGNNRTADKINGEELAKLAGKEYAYAGEREGDKVESLSPDQLMLKLGTRVMFTCNNGNVWQNGTMGIVTACGVDCVKVSLDGPIHREVDVQQNQWQKISYVTDPSGKIEEKIVGKFRQIPLKLAWAITAHKSQGQTFDSLVIQNPNAFFGNAAKMLYTALSRSRTLDGIFLEKKLSRWSLERYGIRVI